MIIRLSKSQDPRSVNSWKLSIIVTKRILGQNCGLSHGFERCLWTYTVADGLAVPRVSIEEIRGLARAGAHSADSSNQ